MKHLSAASQGGTRHLCALEEELPQTKGQRRRLHTHCFPVEGEDAALVPGLLAVTTLQWSVPRDGAASSLVLAWGPCKEQPNSCCKDPLSGRASACSKKSPKCRVPCSLSPASHPRELSISTHSSGRLYIGGSYFCSLPHIDPTKGFPVCLRGGVTLSRVPLSTSPCSNSVSDQLAQTFSPK